MRSRNKPLTPERPVVIVVEGLDYLYLLLSQIRDREAFREVMLWDYAEGAALRDAIGLLRDQNHFRSIRAVGIVTDAEQSRDAAEQRVKSALESNDLATPPQQLTAASGRPFTGFLIMPHDQPTGCLENSCLASSTRSADLVCVDAFYDCVKMNHANSMNSNHIAKLKVHAHIAGCGGNPAMTLGQSGSTGLWDFQHPSLRVMIDFIELMRDAR